MSWTRGFSRLWLVATVAWLCICLFILKRGPDQLGSLECALELAAHNVQNFWCQHLGDASPFRALAIIIGPPVAMLASGVGIGWVLKGFRRPSN